MRYSERERLLDHVKRTVDMQGQVAVIYPVVNKKEDSNIKKVAGDMHEVWKRRFPERTALLHGKMSVEEKRGVVSKMKQHAFDVLVSSTVIERGITLPSLKSLIVVDADN